MSVRFLSVVAAIVTCVALSTASGQEIAAEQLISGLHRPSALAARPGGTADRFELFIADSAAGNVLRWSSQARSKTSEVIRELPASTVAGTARKSDPLALLFLDPGLLVVGTFFDDEKGVLRTFELSEDNQAVSMQPAATQSGKNARSNFQQGDWAGALTRVRANESVNDTLAVAIRGAGAKGALYKARIQSGVISTLGRLTPTDSAGPASLPTALATSSSGRIVAALGGSSDPGSRSRLEFLHPTTGAVELEVRTDLPTITALAYSPTTGSLYAAASGAKREGDDGIYRIDDASESGHAACKTVKIAAVHLPTAIAFGPDAALYITTYGDSDNTGTLQVITGDL